MPYKHTQIGRMIIISSFIVLAYLGAILLRTRSDPEARIPMIILIVVIIFTLASFSTLTVAINEKYLKIKFGYGIFSKRFILEDIDSVEKAKNKRIYGRWIRMKWRPFTWIYNVSGLDAVEIKMKNGKRYRIGTDEPELLEQAIRQHLR